MLTYKNIQDHVLRYLDQAGETGHGLDIVKDAIQATHAKRLSEERWSFMLWPTPQTLTFVNGQRVYQLHSEVLMVTDFWNTSSNQIMKETPSRSRFKHLVQEDRYHFEFTQPSPVRVQPTLGAVTVSGTARIKYIDSNDVVQTEDVTNSSTSGTVKEILQVTKLDSNALILTDIGAVSLLSLSASEYGKSYPQIRLFDDGRSEVGEYRFYRKPTVLSHDNDIPDIPYPFSHILIFDSLLELATYNDSNPPQWWVLQQEHWDRQLRNAYQEGEMEGSESRVVHEVDTYGG